MKNRSINKINILALFLVGLFFNACVSPQKLVETGNYDKAIVKSLKKLSGNKKKRQKYVVALEEAFEKATKRDMAQADWLKQENRPENWEKINKIYRKIRERQENIEPLLPLIDQYGIKANFKFVRVEGLERESKEKAAAYLYEHAQELLTEAENGNKHAARNAHAELAKISEYYRNYRDQRTLLEKARDLGMVNILYKMENHSPMILPRDFQADLERISVRDLNSTWKTFHLQEKAGLNYDYTVVMNLTHIEISPSLVKEREFQESRKIEDGFEYVLDENGNVLKDSLGNDVKVTKYRKVNAWVLETFQNKYATLEGTLAFFDNRTKDVVLEKNLAVDAVFENYASTFRGDDRALSRETKRRIGNQPLPFPTDEAMIFQAAEQLKPAIKNKIAGTRIFI